MAVPSRVLLALALLAAAPAVPAGAQAGVLAVPVDVPAEEPPVPATGPEAACRAEGGDPVLAAELCRRLGFANEMGSMPGTTKAQAVWFYDRACTLASVQGCVAAARLYGAGFATTPPHPDPAGAVKYLRAACELDARECLAYGHAYEAGQGVARSLRTALGIHYRGCEAGVARACTAAAGAHEALRGKPRTATELYLAACDLGDAEGCLMAGARISEGRGAMVDQTLAEALVGRACKLDRAICAKAARR